MLAELLHFPKLRNMKLESAVIHLFVIFFCHRISDYPSITPSLHALAALIKYHYNSFDIKYYDVLDIFQTIIKVLKVQSLAQSIRQKVFNLFDSIISSDMFPNNEQNKQKEKFTNQEGNIEKSTKRVKTSKIKDASINITTINNADNNDNNDDSESATSYLYIIELFGSEQACYDVFCGVVNSIEGEKDPRCLVVALQILSKFIEKFSFLFSLSSKNDLSNSSSNKNNINENDNNKDDKEEIIEKIFENVACYFPITFTPPDDDTYGVTTEMLINSLENVFCVHSVLHKYVLPFLIDHLTDESSVGRVQATKFLVRIGSSEEYSPSVYRYISPGEDSEDSEEHSVLASLAER